MSFSRGKLKDRAKGFLSANYWHILLATVVMALPTFIIQARLNYVEKTDFAGEFWGVFSGIFFISIIVTIFILPAIEVGIYKYMLNIKERGYH